MTKSNRSCSGSPLIIVDGKESANSPTAVGRRQIQYVHHTVLRFFRTTDARPKRRRNISGEQFPPRVFCFYFDSAFQAFDDSTHKIKYCHCTVHDEKNTVQLTSTSLVSTTNLRKQDLCSFESWVILYMTNKANSTPAQAHTSISPSESRDPRLERQSVQGSLAAFIHQLLSP